MLAFGYTAMVAVGGEDSLINPLFGIFYVLLWVGFVPASLLLGPVYKAISPVRTINAAFAKLTGSDPDEGVFTYPERLGYWPAALGLYAFVWMELVYPFATELGPVRLWCAVVRRGDAARRRAVRQHLLRARGPVRGLLDAGLAAVGVGRGGPSSWWSAARWRTSTPRRSGPAWSR